MSNLSKILNITGAKVKYVSKSSNSYSIYLETKPIPHKCPCCSSFTSKIHDYRYQHIKDIPIHYKKCLLILKKRRYHCKYCNKHFYENYDFISRYSQRTRRLTAFIADLFHNTLSIKQIAQISNVSSHSVYRILITLNNSISHLPKAISIDEFRGNLGKEKFQSIVVNPINHSIMDILPSRKSEALIAYFKSFDKKHRLKVEFFSCDMNKTFIDLAKSFFPNAKIVTDRYHFVRQVYWALENVRKRIQKDMPKHMRKYFKKSRSLITRHSATLNKDDKEKLDLMLYYSDDLRKAYFLKETFAEIIKENSYKKQREFLNEWIKSAEQSDIKEFMPAITAFRNNLKYILNSLKYRHISNGPTEGINNKIKVLKRISYGVRNFIYFRNRILMAIN